MPARRREKSDARSSIGSTIPERRLPRRADGINHFVPGVRMSAFEDRSQRCGVDCPDEVLGPDSASTPDARRCWGVGVVPGNGLVGSKSSGGAAVQVVDDLIDRCARIGRGRPERGNVDGNTACIRTNMRPAPWSWVGLGRSEDSQEVANDAVSVVEAPCGVEVFDDADSVGLEDPVAFVVARRSCRWVERLSIDFQDSPSTSAADEEVRLADDAFAVLVGHPRPGVREEHDAGPVERFGDSDFTL